MFLNPVFIPVEGITTKKAMSTGEEDTTTDGAATDGESGESDTTETNTDTSGTEKDNSTTESDTSEDETAQNDADDEEPPSRKPRTNADWVALRRQRKLEKERAKHGEEQGEGEETEDDDDISPEDAKIIEKVVSKRLQPFEEEREIQSIRSEINEFVAKNPDFKDFIPKAEKWARHPSWKNVPTEQLMYAVAGKQLLAIGAKRREEGDRKARETQVGGNSTASSGAKKPVWEMTDAEFSNEVERVKSGK